MNNQRIAVRQGLLLAYALNRTLVLPRWGAGERVDEYLDVQMLNEAWPTLTIDEFNTAGLGRLPTHQVGSSLDALLHFRQHKPPLATAAQVREALSGVSARVVHFDQMFNYRYDHSEAAMMWLLAHVRSAPWIREEAARFIRERLRVPYLAYHSRHLGGECEGRAAKQGMPTTACEHTADQAAAFISALPFHPASMFLASDRERPEVDAEMVRKIGFVMFPFDAVPQSKRHLGPAHGLIDYEILCESNWFVGSWFSTVSLNVHLFRNATGRWSSYFMDAKIRGIQYTR